MAVDKNLPGGRIFPESKIPTSKTISPVEGQTRLLYILISLRTFFLHSLKQDNKS
jgi:hypothetical protein